MPKVSDTKGILRQNLIDAGCDQETVQRCIDLAQGKRGAELRRILARHRRTLLDAVHAEQKKIDCLDYLVYRMNKDRWSGAQGNQ